MRNCSNMACEANAVFRGGRETHHVLCRVSELFEGVVSLAGSIPYYGGCVDIGSPGDHLQRVTRAGMVKLSCIHNRGDHGYTQINFSGCNKKRPHQCAWRISLSNMDLSRSFARISTMELASFRMFHGNAKDDCQCHTNKQKPGGWRHGDWTRQTTSELRLRVAVIVLKHLRPCCTGL
jgi:hypothetical protein